MAATTPLDLIIRFSTSDPDITLHVPNATRTTALALKQLIRERVDAPAKESRLRLIYAGKVLSDRQALTRSLGAAATLPPPSPKGKDEGRSEKAKGKLPVGGDVGSKQSVKAARVYIHCSIGDVLTPAELAEEARQAKEADDALLATNVSTTGKTSTAASTETRQDDATATTTTTPAPRGFDRLLATGFTQPEVAQLRSQFLAIQAHTHTPDTMPTGPELLALEERWLDNSPSRGGSDAGAADAGGFASEDAGGLEDMLYGNLIGFFWPLGAMFWLMREEGVWSRRRQIAVLTGFIVNVTFGFLRIMM